MTSDWQTIVDFIRSTGASDVYLNRCSVKGRVEGRVERLSSAEDFTESRFDNLIRAPVENGKDFLPLLDPAMPFLAFSVPVHGMRFGVNIVSAQGKLCASLR